LTSIISCKNEVTVTATEQAQNELLDAIQGTWSASEVRKDNTLITDFNEFSLSITDQSYTTTNGSPVWPSSGSFDFSSAETENEFLRQDGRLFTASENNGTVTITIVYQEETARGEFGTYEFVIQQ
jgi:ribosomal protein S11